MSEKKYVESGEGDAHALGQVYVDHVCAMTAEGLHDKRDIAYELALRDVKIARLQAENAELVMSLEWALSEIEAKTHYTKENQFGKCLERANETLARHKKD